VTRATFPNLVDAAIDGTALAVRLADPERQTPRLVAALVAAGAQVLEVRAEMPALEDVYHHLMADKELGNLVIGESGN
jgi:2-keto-3-deoxy-6-phosphogluconate aldolase